MHKRTNQKQAIGLFTARIPSSSDKAKVYDVAVDLDDNSFSCTCEAGKRRIECKHVRKLLQDAIANAREGITQNKDLYLRRLRAYNAGEPKKVIVDTTQEFLESLGLA